MGKSSKTEGIIRNLAASIDFQGSASERAVKTNIPEAKPPETKKVTQAVKEKSHSAGRKANFDEPTIGVFFRLPESTRDKLRYLAYLDDSRTLSGHVAEAIEQYYASKVK